MLESILIFIVTVILLFTLIFKLIDGNQDFWTKENIFSLHSNQVFSYWDKYTFRVTVQQLDYQIYRTFKKEKDVKIGGITLFRHPMLYILNLDLLKNILQKDFDHFNNRRTEEFSDPKFKNILFNMSNPDWKDLRAAMTSTFTTSKIKRMYGIFIESSEKMVGFLQSELKKSTDSEVEFRGVCGRYAIDVIATAAFGIDSQIFENENSPFAMNARMLQFIIDKTFIAKFILLSLFPKFVKYFQLSFINVDAVNFLESVLKDSIRRRKELGEKRNDFLQIMLEAQDESIAESQTNEAIDQYGKNPVLVDSKKVQKLKLTDELVIAQCQGVFLAGFDTVEALLMWTCYELALNPDVQDKVYNELYLTTNGDKANLTYDCVNNLMYLDMVVSETLRKYPPGVRVERKCTKNYKIPNDDYVIKKDAHIIVPIYAIHHDPEIYPDPDKFDPERFNTENKASRHPLAYLPFGRGPRSCIAMRMGLMEGKAAFAHMILNFKFYPCSKTDIPMKYSTNGILKPKNGIWLKLESRNF